MPQSSGGLGVGVNTEVVREDEDNVEVAIEVEFIYGFDDEEDEDVREEVEEVEFDRGGLVQLSTKDVDMKIVTVDVGAETVTRIDFEIVLIGDRVTVLTSVAVGVGIDKQLQA